jgi:hypothetical protein
MLRFRIALASVLVIGAGTVGAGLTAASAASVAHVQNKLTKAEQSLAKHVPSSYACTSRTPKAQKDYSDAYPTVKKQAKSIVAAIVCAPTGTSVPDYVIFAQWKNATDMNAFFQAVAADWNVQPDESAGGTTCPQEAGYVTREISARGQKVVRSGLIVCRPSTQDHQAEIVWTEKSHKITGDAGLTSDPDGSLVHAWWNSDQGGVK